LFALSDAEDALDGTSGPLRVLQMVDV